MAAMKISKLFASGLMALSIVYAAGVAVYAGVQGYPLLAVFMAVLVVGGIAFMAILRLGS